MTAPKCGPTHHYGCACWEAGRDAALATATGELAAARERLAQLEALVSLDDLIVSAVTSTRDGIRERIVAALVPPAGGA